MSFLPFLYTLLSRIFIPFFLLFFGSKTKNHKELQGFLPKVTETEREVIWIHALSVGEIAAIKPIVDELRKSFKNPVIYLSVATAAGYKNAQKASFYDYLSYIPLDNPPYIHQALKRINPSLVIITETGFWLNMLTVLQKKNIPAYLLHGRISERSMKRYLAFRGFFCGILDKFELLIAKSELQRDNFLDFGLSDEKVLYLGDSKIDFLVTATQDEISRFRELFEVNNTKVLVAGSTHEGEEEIILGIFNEIKEEISTGLTLIIAPRRIERTKEVVEECNKQQIPFLLRSEIQQKHQNESSRTKSRDKDRVFILDTVGELKTVYGLADLVFIGRSLFAPGGGHSALEPAIEGKFSLFGPYFSYNIEDGERIEKIGGAKQVANIDELKNEIKKFLQEPPKGYHENLIDFFAKERGASKRIVEKIRSEKTGVRRQE